MGRHLPWTVLGKDHRGPASSFFSFVFPYQQRRHHHHHCAALFSSTAILNHLLLLSHQPLTAELSSSISPWPPPPWPSPLLFLVFASASLPPFSVLSLFSLYEPPPPWVSPLFSFSSFSGFCFVFSLSAFLFSVTPTKTKLSTLTTAESLSLITIAAQPLPLGFHGVIVDVTFINAIVTHHGHHHCGLLFSSSLAAGNGLSPSLSRALFSLPPRFSLSFSLSLSLSLFLSLYVAAPLAFPRYVCV